MADKLAKMRTKFVKNVSVEIIKQLLDYLLDEKILNDGEKNSIMEGNQMTSDKARQLIDTVKKKGNTASNKLISHLQECDPTLYENLCCGVIVKSAVQESQVPNEPQEWSPTLRKTTYAFWKDKQNKKDVYPVTLISSKNRVALLITNITFEDESHNRNGAAKDEEDTEKLLNDLGYEVVKHTNLTAKQMDDALVKFSKHPKLKETDSVFVVIMSHGKRGVVCGVKSNPFSEEERDELPIDNIYNHLNAQNCPYLVNKPKIIIIQACRGKESGKVPKFDSVMADGAIVKDAIEYIHKEKDFSSLLSSTPDTPSYRHKTKGSFLIQFIVEVFNNFAHDTNIDELFRKVMQRFEELESKFKQMPTKDRCTLTRNFFLFPGLNQMS
ncbi:hypothetical protein WMY93_028822 [Mugilogobius chulae]|uniref:Caspase-1 n=1 Tax=Mugilogobius chulae TaxID=88201 RepID=A0AAW0N1Q9_9GOBI